MVTGEKIQQLCDVYFGFKEDFDFLTSLPCTGVCIKILRNDNRNYRLDRNGTNGLGFCFLPLPKNFNLKFHVNGNFYLTSTREDIVNASTSDRTNVNKTKWNEFLKKCLVSTLLECFEIINQKVDYTTNDLMSIWPLNLDKNFKVMEAEFMKQVFDYRQQARSDDGYWRGKTIGVHCDVKIAKNAN